MPHLDTRLCMLLCIIPLVVGDLIEEEEERTPVDEKDSGLTDCWKEKKVAGKCHNDLVSSLQVLGDYQSLLTPPQSVLAASNQAAAKAMLFVSGITIGSAYFDCLNMTEMPVDCCKLYCFQSRIEIVYGSSKVRTTFLNFSSALLRMLFLFSDSL